MKTRNEKAIYAAIGIVAIVAAYRAGTQQSTPETDSSPQQKQAEIESVPEKTVSNTPIPSLLPDSHPPSNPDQGRSVDDKGIRFAHFRVGNSNVKAILNDGDTLWVGTSGGVIRYDKTKDEHRLFDVRSGLLSNGIFHLSKYGKKLVVGTYGGGLHSLIPILKTGRTTTSNTV